MKNYRGFFTTALKHAIFKEVRKVHNVIIKIKMIIKVIFKLFFTSEWKQCEVFLVLLGWQRKSRIVR